MTGRVEQLRSEMSAALAEATAQEEYDTADAEYLKNPSDPDLRDRRRGAALALRVARETMRTERGRVPDAVTPAPARAKGAVKGRN
ncbi:MAG: hypothetical protein PVJ28_00215 [Acidimicrobiia bacterium]|jgi:hypothetical protein